MNGHEFESYLKEILVLNNHHVLLTPKSRDQGADLIVTKDGERIAIQAKRYSHPVGNKAVQEVLGAIHYYDCDSGIVITTSSYTSSAKQLAHKANIKLWSKKEIKELIYGIREK
jgi:restriction system protein